MIHSVWKVESVTTCTFSNVLHFSDWQAWNALASRSFCPPSSLSSHVATESNPSTWSLQGFRMVTVGLSGHLLNLLIYYTLLLFLLVDVDLAWESDSFLAWQMCWYTLAVTTCAVVERNIKNMWLFKGRVKNTELLFLWLYRRGLWATWRQAFVRRALPGLFYEDKGMWTGLLHRAHLGP